MMVGQVVWVAGQRQPRFAQYVEVFRAAVFHYQRVVMGPQFGMNRTVA